MAERLYFRKEEELHNAQIYLRRTYDWKLCAVRNGLPKGAAGMLEVSEYQAAILKSTYDVF